MVDEELSEALVIVVGYGGRNHPRDDYTSLSRRFGVSRAADLAARVETILKELARLRVDWSKHSLASGGDEARKVMAGRHPELSDQALEALAWKFTFEWR